MSQFVDQVRIKISSGNGGNGMIAWRREKYEPMGGPAGGNGGRGGSVILEANSDMSTLIDFRYQSHYEAQAGAKGGPKGMHGRGAPDLIIKVPVGTVVLDAETKQAIADLTVPQQSIVVAEGGLGGRGNAQLASHSSRAPHYCEPGQPGVTRELELELKLLADVGLVGLPNAGKSTLLSILTAARPKIAAYPFSTLEPNLGVARKPNGDGFVIADIPGLISGASQGTGLGHKFLRHIERTRLLVHLCDLSDEDPVSNINVINNELLLYNQRLSRLPQILVLNKADLCSPEDQAVIKQKLQKDLNIKDIVVISCATRAGIDTLNKLILDHLNQIQPELEVVEVVPDDKAQHVDEGFEIIRRKKAFIVESERVDRLVAVTQLKNPESLFHLHKILRAMGVIDALISAGVQPGHTVTLGDVSFVYGEDFH